MLKSFQNTRVLSLVFGATAFAALAFVTPAAAQGVPDALRHLDTPQPFNDTNLTDAQQTKVRSAYDHVRKHHHHVAAQ